MSTSTTFWLINILILIVFPIICFSQENLRVPAYDAGVFDPDNKPATIQYVLLKELASVKVLVEDFRGRVIEKLDFIDLRKGEHKFTWAGHDKKGDKLPDGQYRFVIIADFSDQSPSEEQTITIRIVTIPGKKVSFLPEPLPLETYNYKTDGYIASFWRRNSEEDVVRSGETRSMFHLNINTENQTFDGIASARRPHYNGDTNYDSSSAMVEQRWSGGQIKGVFRRGLGNFDDPMKLFSDYRTERKKIGTRIDHSYGLIEFSGLKRDCRSFSNRSAKGMESWYNWRRTKNQDRE